MLGHVLWVVDNELDSKAFERLSIDLLYRQGFKDITPVEPQDGGRDAEEYPREGRGRSGGAAFFQFSKAEDWRRKIRSDAGKLRDRGFEFSTLVFVTSRKARGVDIDQVTSEIRSKYGWDLIVFSREWLRLQLEEIYPDLAKKYLGIDVPEWSAHLAAKLLFEGPQADGESRLWAAIQAKEYERAIPELKLLLDGNPERMDAWEALAWSQYSTFDYDGALASIARVKPIEESPQALSIRACILAEKGIRDGSRAMLVEARDLFSALVASDARPFWMTHYNLGNTLSALGDYEEAIPCFERAQGLNPDEPTVLKNLATAHHHLGNHEKELEFLDKALDRDPLMPEALVSKGVCLLIDFKDAKGAIPLLERAIEFNKAWSGRWPHVWYWAALALLEDGQASRALELAQDGLLHQPGHHGLRSLKLRLLDMLTSEDAEVSAKAKPFWLRRLEEEPLDFQTRIHLVDQEEREGDLNGAWGLLDGSFSALGIKTKSSLSSSGFSVGESGRAMAFLPQYSKYRDSIGVSRYWDQDDPLYDLSFSPPQSPNAEDFLFVGFSVPFGLGFELLEKIAFAKRSSCRTLQQFFDTLRQAIERSLLESAQAFAHLIPSQKASVEAVADRVSEVLTFLGLIALREFGAQRGWIMSQFRIPRSAMDEAMVGYDESAIEANVVSKGLVSLNDAAGFLPRST